MDALFIPTENDFRKWIRDAVKECLENTPPKSPPAGEKEDALISRKEIAQYLGLSLVTLTDWMMHVQMISVGMFGDNVNLMPGLL
jgi:hypothetical protein